MTFARWGIMPLFLTTLVLGWGLWLLPDGWPRWIGYAVAGFLWLFVVWFFRNPHRVPQGDSRCLTAPADGVIDDIAEADHPWLGKCRRVGIFLSVFDVHVNRSPVDGRIVHADYRPGAFLDVRNPNCRELNEANELGVAVDDAVAPGLRIVVRQIAGLIARRIVCTHTVGDRLSRGELFGMIRFGSRTEIWLPIEAPHQVAVTLGQRVKCGETIMVRLGQTAVVTTGTAS